MLLLLLLLLLLMLLLLLLIYLLLLLLLLLMLLLLLLLLLMLDLFTILLFNRNAVLCFVKFSSFLVCSRSFLLTYLPTITKTSFNVV